MTQIQRMLLSASFYIGISNLADGCEKEHVARWLQNDNTSGCKSTCIQSKASVHMCSKLKTILKVNNCIPSYNVAKST